MKRAVLLSIVVLAMFMLNAITVAQEDAVSVCGTFRGSARALPSVSSSQGLDLTISLAGFKAMSSTNFTVLPMVNASQSFTLAYTWESFTFGSTVNLRLVPAAFQSWKIYTKAIMPSTTIGEGENAPTFAGNLRLDAIILPAFSGTGRLYMNMGMGPLSMSGTSVVGLLPVSFQTQKFSFTVDFLKVTLNKTGTSSLHGKAGTNIDVLPSLATAVWLDLSLSLGDLTANSKTNFQIIPGGTGTQVFTVTYSIESVTLTSRSTFGLAPYGFNSQYLKINATHNGLSVYGWGSLATSGLSAGIGFSYNFCVDIKK